jgi:hypothetical protein
MKKFLLSLFVVFVLFFGAETAHAQADAEGLAWEMETLHNGTLSIEYECTAYGDFDAGDGTTDYQGVSIGDSSEKGCMLLDPNGASTYFQDSSVFTGWALYPPTLYEQVTVSGNWGYYASFWIWFWPCDSDSENCVGSDGDTYAYEDPWGFIAYAGYPANCPLNNANTSQDFDYCSGQYDSNSYLTNDNGLAYAYAGNSWGNAGSFYVDALAIGISPSSYTLYGGDSVTFTAEVSNTGGYLPIYSWTLNQPNGQHEVGSGSTFTYTAPSEITSAGTATLKGCVTNLTADPVCQTVSIDLIAETIDVSTPSPNVLLADGTSTASIQANVSGASEDAAVNWTGTYDTTMPSGLSSTYTAPLSSAVTWGSANTVPVNITATIQGSSPNVSDATSLTLVQPVSIKSVSPASWTAGTGFTATITGTGFSANSSVVISSPSWPLMNSTCATPTSITTITCAVAIPANLANVTASQPATITVSTTTSGITSTATSNPISIAPVVYTYAITLTSTSSSLTYGYTSTITPIITCKTSNGAACASGVLNPQEANFSIISGLGSLTNLSNATSTTYTDAALIGYPSLNATVQGCASMATNVCASTNISDAATTLTLNPATLASPLTGGMNQAFSASVQNAGKATGLTWTASPTSAASGTLTSATTTITGPPTSGTSANTYTAPSTITTPTTVTLNACMSANTSICAVPVAITLNPLPTFSVTATNNNPSQTALSLGHTMSYTVMVAALYGFSGTVTLSQPSGLPAGVTASWSSNTISASGSATLTLTSAYSASTYIGNSTITITGTSGSLVNSAPSFALTTQELQYPCSTQ